MKPAPMSPMLRRSISIQTEASTSKTSILFASVPIRPAHSQPPVHRRYLAEVPRRRQLLHLALLLHLPPRQRRHLAPHQQLVLHHGQHPRRGLFLRHELDLLPGRGPDSGNRQIGESAKGLHSPCIAISFSWRKHSPVRAKIYVSILLPKSSQIILDKTLVLDKETRAFLAAVALARRQRFNNYQPDLYEILHAFNQSIYLSDFHHRA
jgi:hypothetical protein